MEIGEYLQFLRRRLLFLILGAVAGLAGALSVVTSQTATYTASLRIYVGGAPGGDTSALIATLGEIASTQSVISNALQTAGAGSRVSVIASQIGRASVIRIDVASPSAVTATRVAGAYSSVLPAAYSQVVGPSTVRLSTLDESPASAPSAHRNLTLAVGLGLGLLAGLGLAVLRQVLDQRLADVDAVLAATGAPVLASVPGDPDRLIGRNLRSPAAEAYRRVRTDLVLGARQMPRQAILITASSEAEARVSAAVNLATAFALTGDRVLLVDANLRQGEVAETFGWAPGQGLVDHLTSGQAVATVTRQAPGELFAVIPAGEPVDNASEVLGTEAMREFLNHSRASYDRIVLLAPPALPVTDAAILATMSDGVVFVVHQKLTNRTTLEEAAEELRGVGATVLGTLATGGRAGLRRTSRLPGVVQAPASPRMA